MPEASRTAHVALEEKDRTVGKSIRGTGQHGIEPVGLGAIACVPNEKRRAPRSLSSAKRLTDYRVLLV